MRRRGFGIWSGVLAVLLPVSVPRMAGAHCDTLDGPVVATARAALEKGDVTPGLKWVKEEHEPEIRSAFARTPAVRGKGPEARELADSCFFETLVRRHRSGEGAPDPGLKPAGTELGPAVAGADKAPDGGSAEALVKLVAGDVTAGIRERFARVGAALRHADDSVETAREYVEAYVDEVHDVERVLAAASGRTHHGAAEDQAQEHHAAKGGGHESH